MRDTLYIKNVDFEKKRITYSFKTGATCEIPYSELQWRISEGHEIQWGQWTKPEEFTCFDRSIAKENAGAYSKLMPSNDQVNHPSHYGGADSPYEAIKVIEAWGLDFHTGNAVKYLSRAGKKDPAKLKEDLHKALWYIQRKIEKLP